MRGNDRRQPVSFTHRSPSLESAGYRSSCHRNVRSLLCSPGQSPRLPHPVGRKPIVAFTTHLNTVCTAAVCNPIQSKYPPTRRPLPSTPATSYMASFHRSRRRGPLAGGSGACSAAAADQLTSCHCHTPLMRNRPRSEQSRRGEATRNKGLARLVHGGG